MFIILLVQFGLLSGHLLGKSCPLGWPLSFVYLFFFIYFPLWFKSGMWLLIDPVPVHCFSITCVDLFYDKNNLVSDVLYGENCKKVFDM